MITTTLSMSLKNEVPAHFSPLGAIIEEYVLREKPERILEISGGEYSYSKLFLACLRKLGLANGTIENRLPDKTLGDTDTLGVYDFIFIHGVLEQMTGQEAFQWLSRLQNHVKKQVLAVTPEYINEKNGKRREFHPLVFTGLDFSYWLHKSAGGNWQFYSIFPKQRYEAIAIDERLTAVNHSHRKMSLAFILPHRGLTGGLKALLQQMRRLRQRGHIVKAYFRSNDCNRVIPDWSTLQDEELSEQIVVPQDARYLDYIKDVDIICVGWMDLIPQFTEATVPVVLWEQGYEYLFGDYGQPIDSSYDFRRHMAKIYRMPVHILAVSPVISEILLAKYNRKSRLFPPCVDTELYFPWEKNDELPPVLLVGHPKLDFKGFDFAFDVLKKAWEQGARFTVWWAFQVEAKRRDTPFEVKYYHMLTPESLALLYRFAFVFMFTSLYEAFSLPPLEAMASGTAVLATDNGGIRSYALPEENCLLCEQGDLEGMARRLADLLANPALREKLGENGRKTALDFSAERVSEKIEGTLRSIAFAEIEETPE